MKSKQTITVEKPKDIEDAYRLLRMDVEEKANMIIRSVNGDPEATKTDNGTFCLNTASKTLKVLVGNIWKTIISW